MGGLSPDRSMMNARFGTCVLLLVWALCVPALAVQTPPVPESKGSLAPLFQSQILLEITIEAPLGALLTDQKRDRRKKRPGKLTFIDLDGSRKTVPLEIRLAGRSRADPNNCDSMPMNLYVRAEDVAGTLFESQELLRYTKHCKNSDRYEQFVIEEHLIFQILNLFTEQSYRTRLLKVRYVDTTFGRKQVVRHAFFIEHETLMAARNGWQTLLIEKAERFEIEPNQAALLGVFQYLIGNTDWSVLRGEGKRCCHNTQIIGDEAGPIIPVPYDFDSAGIIDVPYARPSRVTGIGSVRERLYRGLCDHNPYLPEILDRFRHHRKAIYGLYENQEGLSLKRKRRAFDYLDDFYQTINTPELLDTAIYAACR
jgi:hypothetical protein